MSETNVSTSTQPPARSAPAPTPIAPAAPPAPVESPPPAQQPAKTDADPRARLHAMARELVRTRNRRVLIEYLRLRRAIA